MKGLLCALLSLGFICGTHAVIDWVAIGAAVSSAVMSGTSMLHASLSSVDYNVAIEVVMENWSKYPLTMPAATSNGGYIKFPPVTVKGGQRENFIAHKTGNTATGTYGTASWLIQNSQYKRAVVMWSVPYSQDFHSNWLGVGLTAPEYRDHKDWFNQMYGGKSGSGLNFVRGEYYSSVRTISIKDDKFEITGTMGTTHKTKAHIIFRPLNEEDVADSLKDIVRISRRSGLNMIDLFQGRSDPGAQTDEDPTETVQYVGEGGKIEDGAQLDVVQEGEGEKRDRYDEALNLDQGGSDVDADAKDDAYESNRLLQLFKKLKLD